MFTDQVVDQEYLDYILGETIFNSLDSDSRDNESRFLDYMQEELDNTLNPHIVLSEFIFMDEEPIGDPALNRF